MTNQNWRRVRTLLVIAMPVFLLGCKPVQQTKPAVEAADNSGTAVAPEIEQVAEAALGKQAEIAVHGDLARNGLEQLLVLNRSEKAAGSDARPGAQSGILITRAAILEKNNGKWNEVLRCDEHLKNPNGYIGGSPAARVAGWRLEFKQDAKQGLELRFTPAEAAAGGKPSDSGESVSQTIVVQWNARAKRYQALNRSHEGYLGEAPTLETPQSILR
jgi:hypothetical protein